MPTNPTVIAICGSTRQGSTNHQLISAIKELYKGRLLIKNYDDIASIPHFNPDLDNDTPPSAVADFRDRLRRSDGILICTPEYAMGVPGTLKNAIDWTVSSMEFSHKPVALITASSVGEKGHQSLLETLKIIESDIPDATQLLISYIKTKVKNGMITDIPTLTEVMRCMDALITKIKGHLAGSQA